MGCWVASLWISLCCLSELVLVMSKKKKRVSVEGIENRYGGIGEGEGKSR